MHDAYAICPCGSGKKFKWCCQPIQAEIDKAFSQSNAGQHDAALRTIDKVTADHPDNPQAWGSKAQFLFRMGKTDEAESALQKAFDLNPEYAFGHFLKGSFRLHEGEAAGALMLFRKAANLYDPAARDILAELYLRILECEMKLNHPLAGRAAASLALRFDSGDEELRKSVDTIFAPANPNLPASAKKEYKFLPVAAAAAPARRPAWENALASAATGKLTDACRAFAQLTQDDPADTAAWYNLGLSQAWLGNNAAALEAFERYVALEPDESQAAAAWVLAEIVRCGHGLEDQADYLQYSRGLALVDPQVFVGALQKLQELGLVAGLQLNQERTVLQGLVLLEPPPALTPELQAKQVSHLGAFFVLMGNMLHLWHSAEPALDQAVALLQPHLGQTSPVARSKGPVQFHDFYAETLIFPPSTVSEDEFRRRLEAEFVRFLEETWLHRPLKALGGAAPIDAAGHPTLRKKLRGAVLFLEEVAALAKLPYDFNRLRRKVNLLEVTASSPGSEAAPDIAAMGSAELARLDLAGQTDVQLEEAFVTALKLDARELASNIARALVARQARPERPERYPFFNQLIQLAIAQGDIAAALDQVNEGEKDDCEHNEGRRRNDYELRRAELQIKAGQVDEGQDVFDRLIARVPTELKYKGSAAEAMLSARQPVRALRFADQGLAEARKQNNRDSEQYFLELAAAARKQGA